MSQNSSSTGDKFTIVGIGASAGGLGAFEKFFTAMPADSGMAFVLIQHLDPTHESMTAHLLSRYTSMKVIEAGDQMPVEANTVYIIPPNAYLSVRDRRLYLSEPKLQRGMRLPIDHFLRSLAESQQERAIAIILSGTGSDGTLGVRAVKGEGGIALAQSPETAQYDGMPRSAIATGLMDYVGPIESMADVLVRYNAHAYTGLPAEPTELDSEEPDLLRSILSVLQTRIKYDFRCYKKGTLLRRIRRRMGLNQIESLEDYLQFMRKHPDEPTLLFRDLLIGVTGFFREAQAFEALEDAIARIVDDKAPEQPIRIWVPACASGEEPYSIAMLVSERLHAERKNCPIQLFATDIDDESLAIARTGRYPENIAADVSPERLQRFFRHDGNSYRVSKHIRDAVVFAVQNLVMDPPFSRLDLVSCRNLLIYLKPEVQKKVIDLFHFSLNTGGYLFLGNTETIGQQENLFEPVVKKWRLYRRIGAVHRNVTEFPIFPGPQGRVGVRFLDRPVLNDPARLGEFTRGMLLEKFAPASILVDRKQQILYYHGQTGRYFEQPAGPPNEDLMRKVREGLRLRLRGLLHRALHESAGEASAVAELHENDTTRRVRITVNPVKTPAELEGMLVISFEEAGEVTDLLDGKESGSASDEDALLQQLEHELQSTRDDLQSTIEELETSNEELKAANEEVMSMNEELQSTNEELETSKEELQSLNEELTTVNSQLEENLRELESTNDDLDNLWRNTHIAMVFLDRDFRIKRFTPATSRLFNLIPSDLGRPLSDISCRFDDAGLLTDAGKVLDHLAPLDKEVRADTEADGWYLRRILPYRTQDDRIEGVVITFVEITERKRAAEQFRLIVEAAPNAVVVVNSRGQIEFVNVQTEQYFGYDRKELVGKPVEILLPERYRDRHPGHRDAYFANPQSRSMGEDRKLFGRRMDGSEFPVEIGLSPVIAEWGTYVLATIVDVTERQRMAQLLLEAKQQAERANQAKSFFLASASHDLRQPLQTLVLLNGVLERKVSDSGLQDVIRRQDLALASMMQMMNMFLDLCRIDAGSIEPDVTAFPVSVLLERLGSEYAKQAQDRGLALHIVPCTATILSDAGLLYRILQNLVANAIHYTGSGRVLAGCRRRGGSLRIEVWDTGPGIPADRIDAIFEEFVQLDNPARQADKGYGVGLSIAKHLAQLLRHRLNVRSTPGKCTMFSIEVPLTQPAATVSPDSGGTQFVRYEGKPGARVLVVDDDAGVLASTRQLLESIGLTVIAASGGREALSLIETGVEPPELIIADYRLAEDGSGIEVIHRVLDALEQSVPALLLTGDTLPESVRTLEASGFRVLQKPVEANQLVACMNELLRR